MRNVPRGLPLWSSQCIFQKPIQAPVSFNAGTSFQHTTHQRVASLTPPGSLQVAATILGGIFIKNTENNQFSPSNHQLYTGLQKIRVQLAVSQRISQYIKVVCSLQHNVDFKTITGRSLQARLQSPGRQPSKIDRMTQKIRCH